MPFYNALTLICKVLSFKANTDSIKIYLQQEHIDWELIVKIASNHLVLPAFYCRLVNKRLIHLIPEDLERYLKEITNLNYERNKKLLDEVKNISSILKSNNINHVFLKGSAMLVLDSYTNIAERMVGDIDILVSKEQLSHAFDLIKKNNYAPVKLTLESKHFDNKHLPRLIPTKAIMAIEIHKKLLKKKPQYLNPETVLASKQVSNTNVFVPNNNHLLDHIIYNYQINDNGYYYGNYNLRSFYDALIVLNKHKDDTNNTDKYKRAFFTNGAVLFDDLKISNDSVRHIQKKWFICKLKNTYINTLNNKVLRALNTLKILISRTILFVKNPSYRSDILKDRKRIYKLIRHGRI